MKVKEALKIIREIDNQRQALNKIGEVLKVTEGIESGIKNLESQRERLKREVADAAEQGYKAAALLETQHANESQRMKTELDGLAQSLRDAGVEHESKMAAFEREEQEAKQKHKAAALLEAQHANETQRMKTELDGLAQSLRNARMEHESKMAAFEREEQEAKNKLDEIQIAIKPLTELFRQSDSNLTYALGAD